MLKVAALKGGFKFKGPDGKWYYIDSRTVAKYPQFFYCVQGRGTATGCKGKYRADGPGLDQLHLVAQHVHNCQLLVQPEDNNLMKDQLKLAILGGDIRPMTSIFEEIKMRY